MIAYYWELRRDVHYPARIIATHRKGGLDGMGRRIDEHTGQQISGTLEEVHAELRERRVAPVNVKIGEITYKHILWHLKRDPDLGRFYAPYQPRLSKRDVIGDPVKPWWDGISEEQALKFLSSILPAYWHVRVIRYGEGVTCDCIFDRVNVEIGSDGIVEKVWIG